MRAGRSRRRERWARPNASRIFALARDGQGGRGLRVQADNADVAQGRAREGVRSPRVARPRRSAASTGWTSSRLIDSDAATALCLTRWRRGSDASSIAEGASRGTLTRRRSHVHARRVWRLWRARLDRRGRKRAREEAASAMRRDAWMRTAPQGSPPGWRAGTDARSGAPASPPGSSRRVGPRTASSRGGGGTGCSARGRAARGLSRLKGWRRAGAVSSHRAHATAHYCRSSGGSAPSSEGRTGRALSNLGCKRAARRARAGRWAAVTAAVDGRDPGIAPRGFVSFPRLLQAHLRPPTPPSPWVGRPPRTPPASCATSSARPSASVMTPEDRDATESVIVDRARGASSGRRRG